MYPVYEVLGFALHRVCWRRRHVPLLAGVFLLLSGCGQPAAPTNREITRTTASVDGQRAVATAITTDAVGPLSVEELARKTALEAELADGRPTHRLKLRNGHLLEGRIVSETPSVIRFRDGFGYSGFVVQSYRRSDVLTVETLPATAFEVTPRDVRCSAEFP